MMEIIDELLSSRRVGYRNSISNRGDWEDKGIDNALQQPSLLVRFRKTLRFVNSSVDTSTLKRSTILDAGEYNPLSKWLRELHGITVQNTPPDLDFDHWHKSRTVLGQFDYIFAFEIIEHLMNPLAFLELLKSCMKENARIFLSTPFDRPRILWSKYHVTEYFPDKIELMARKAGLCVKRYSCVHAYSWKSAFLGVRPFLRWIWFERIMLFELAKELESFEKS